MSQEEKKDPSLTIEQKNLVAALDKEDLEIIDKALISHVGKSWRKVARVVGTTMMHFDEKFQGIPDVFFASRIQKLAKSGLIESQGNVDKMRFSEIRVAKR